MSEELLSALLDGECSPGEVKRLMEELERSPALKQRWSRMCAVRDAMAETRMPALSADFCSGVMAAIERDRAVPQPSKVVALPVRSRPAAANATRWQPFAGLAAAASIAAVAAIGGYRMLNAPIGAPVQTASVAPALSGAQPVSFAGAANDAGQARLIPVSATSSAGDEPVETRWSQLDADTARQLSEYMMEHSNMRGEGVGGALSYPRMTLRTAEYRTGERH
jgi:negative regulator of sigma E activity